MKISAIVPTYNNSSTLNSCVESLREQDLLPLEIIVIDNASVKAIKKNRFKFKKNRPKVKIVRNKKNLGVTGGRNKGIQEADRKSDYLLFFDHDMVADKSMLSELIKTGESQTTIGIVTPKIRYGEDRQRIWAAGTKINLWTGQVLFRGGKDQGQYEKDEEVEVAPAAILVKRALIEKIKGFDNRYFATFEDTDFCFRARKLGFKTYYSFQAKAYHFLSTKAEDEAGRLLKRAYWLGRNRILFMKDFGKNLFVFVCFLPVFGLYYSYLAIRYKRPLDGLRFFQGTAAGFFTKK